MDSVFKQARHMRLDSKAMGGGLPGKLSLNFGPDINGDGHGVPFYKDKLSLYCLTTLPRRPSRRQPFTTP
jgi:hypothetical protein